MEFHIKLSIYFEITDAELYGGEDSIGYASSGVEIFQINYEKDNLFNKKELMEKYIDDQAKAMAAMAKVPIENVRVISKEEYEINADDE